MGHFIMCCCSFSVTGGRHVLVPDNLKKEAIKYAMVRCCTFVILLKLTYEFSLGQRDPYELIGMHGWIAFIMNSLTKCGFKMLLFHCRLHLIIKI